MASPVSRLTWLRPNEPESRSTGAARLNRPGDGLMRTQSISAGIWSLLGLIFLVDLWTPPDDVFDCFAYMIPIFASLLETRPQPMRYAAAASVLSIAGMLVQPPSIGMT